MSSKAFASVNDVRLLWAGHDHGRSRSGQTPCSP